MGVLRIGLVDDDGMVRRLLVDTLGREADIEIAWDVDSGEAALEAFKSGPVEILLLDLQMPGMDGIETITEFQRRDEPPLIVVVSALTTLDKVQAAFRAGAVGFFMKEDDAGLIAQSLRRALRGELVFSPKCSQVVVARLTGLAADAAEGEEYVKSHGILSERELQVVRLVAEALENKQIASELDISVATVKKHVQSIMDKLGTDNRAGIVAKAFRAGLLQ
ncbi:response regulator receiver domain protein [Mobiluncus mulieris 28-1]|uniref:Response regulator receiver domain protein n=2 Tax=Mobiluncus mulieris TaxID=2052 RepID=E0QSE7_9ACTO|nr:response regulator transcription factor [Mobiluncus mulieris]EEJ53868.1 response regulator receiver domain protein [Mobiluncus mulieris ATCC 35243]EEZ91628.1 response regulator receiver domain protein [Mobiluncus mulieris 28-1]EFM45522.1 response regulator receiver domain protein [Mobiluncus mulieris ATCC 35239]MCU9971688.1 response regulator transcription factor [Mobiluncus mulieris]MCU9975927.1 response regulator transcription factor [Mobiluncus mulieris]